MAAPIQLSFLKRHTWLPARRFIALDLGSRCIKVLLGESLLGHFHLLHHQLIDLQEEGLLTPEEINRHIQQIVHELGDYPVALALPQHLSISQVIDLPQVEQEEINRLIEEETIRLSGLSESALIYDYVRLRPFGRYRNPFWVTLCQEAQILDQIERLGLDSRDTAGVTTATNALMASYLATQPQSTHAVLIDLGSGNTGVAVLLEGQGVYATSFPIGSDQFTEAIAAEKGCSWESAEGIKRSEDLLTSAEPAGTLADAVHEWHRELTRVLQEWLGEHGEHQETFHTMPMVLAGGGAAQPGFIEYLNQHTSPRFVGWPSRSARPAGLSLDRFAVAYGATLQALGKAPQSASLLPGELKAARAERGRLQRLQSFNLILLLLLVVMMGLGTWQKMDRINEKEQLEAEIKSTLKKVDLTYSLARQLNQRYEQIRPIVERQQHTLATLKTLTALEEVRGKLDFWCVLFADQKSYFAGTTDPSAKTQTNQPPQAGLTLTNITADRSGFIVEVCTPEGDAMRRSLELVRELKQEPFTANVDSLPEARRRSLANTNVVVPSRYFSLVVELPKTDFRILESPGTSSGSASSSSSGRKRSSSRLPWQQPEESADSDNSDTSNAR